VVKLKPRDIESERKLVFIKGAKNRKDRCSILSDTALRTLRKYWEKHRPKVWLFEGKKGGRYITIRSVKKVFEKACKSVASVLAVYTNHVRI